MVIEAAAAVIWSATGVGSVIYERNRRAIRAQLESRISSRLETEVSRVRATNNTEIEHQLTAEQAESLSESRRFD